MYRLIVKANNIRQVGATLEAENVSGLAVRVLQYGEGMSQWIVDLVARPADEWLTTLLNKWVGRTHELGAFVEGRGFEMGSLLYWCEMDGGWLDVRNDSRKMVDQMILSPNKVNG